MSKIYISGKITGDINYKEKFMNVKKKLEKQGHIVLNPVELPDGMEYEDYMVVAFAMIDVSDKIYMLEDWKESSGAIRELYYAKSKRKEEEYEEEIND